MFISKKVFCRRQSPCVANMKSPSVCILVFGAKNGIAGHHYSVHDLAVMLRNSGVLTHVCVAGLKEGDHSRILENCSDHYSLDLSRDRLANLCEFRKRIKRERYDAIIPVDEIGCRVVDVLFPIKRPRLIPLKPGWVNSSSWISSTSDFICFSRENFDFFQNHRKYSRTCFHLLPNRVIPVEASEKRIAEIKRYLKIDPSAKIVVAASRVDIGAYGRPGKKAVFESALSLFNQMAGCSDVHLVAMGAPANKISREWLGERYGNAPNVHQLIDHPCLSEMSAILALGDIVVSTGRTAMESLSLGIPTFMPVQAHGEPILIDDVTLEQFAYSNFSGRAITMDSEYLSQQSGLARQILNDDRLLAGIKANTRKLFEDNLNVSSVSENYRALITKSETARTSLNGLLEWLNSVFRVFVVVSGIRRFCFKK